VDPEKRVEERRQLVMNDIAERIFRVVQTAVKNGFASDAK